MTPKQRPKTDMLPLSPTQRKLLADLQRLRQGPSEDDLLYATIGTHGVTAARVNEVPFTDGECRTLGGLIARHLFDQYPVANGETLLRLRREHRGPA
jgi:hypothetical protein